MPSEPRRTKVADVAARVLTILQALLFGCASDQFVDRSVTAQYHTRLARNGVATEMPAADCGEHGWAHDAVARITVFFAQHDSNRSWTRMAHRLKLKSRDAAAGAALLAE